MRFVPALLAAALAAARPARAHVCYVAEGAGAACAAPAFDAGALFGAALHPAVLAALVLGAVALPVGAVAWTRALRGRAAPWTARLLDTLRSYEDLLPWMLRLALGIALFAAGTTRTLLSPLVEAPPGLALAELVAGFLLLLGFLVRPAALVALALWGAALAGGHAALGVAEAAGAAVALLLLGGGRPGVDHLLRETLRPRGALAVLLGARPERLGRAAPWTPVALRVALAASLAYGAFAEKLLNVDLAARVAREHALPLFPPEGWALLVGLAELALAALFLAGAAVRAASAATFVVLTLTLFLFGENLATHVTLFGVASWLFTTGAGPASVDRLLHPERGRRPSKLAGVPRAVAE